MAIPEAEKLQLAGNSYYHSLLGYLYAVQTRMKPSPLRKSDGAYEIENRKAYAGREIGRVKNAAG